MDVDRILSELRAERDRIEQAISAVAGLNSTGQRQTIRRAPRATASSPRKRGRMSVAARRKLSQLLKRRWAQGKMGRGAKVKPSAKSSKPARRMSQAARNRIAAAQRARWAKVRAAQKAA
jgi:hypothetical protein